MLYHCLREKHGVNTYSFLAQLSYTFTHDHSVSMNFKIRLTDLINSLQIVPTISHKNTLA